MLINELPDDCFLTIFDHLNNLDDLINCYKVCIKWSYLIVKRTKKVKYLIGHSIGSVFTNRIGTFDYVYYRELEPIDGSCLTKLFSNLIIADVSCEDTLSSKDIVTLVRRQECLKGLIYFCGASEGLIDYNGLYDDLDKSKVNYCDKLEMLSCDGINSSIKQNGSSLKQLHLWNYPLEYFIESAHCFPNLEKLRIHNREFTGKYNGPVFNKLKILEHSISTDRNATYSSFSFMDSCPNLQSAYIHSNAYCLSVDESLKHNSLQDLVLDLSRISWDEFKSLLMKYPNLKHFALRNNYNIKDKHVKQLVYLLPNLVVFDVLGCPGVTQSAADYVQDYCKRYGRSIKFYFEGNRHKIELDWPQLSTKKEKFSLGFDFMKHCFFESFYDLSFFLIPVEN